MGLSLRRPRARLQLVNPTFFSKCHLSKTVKITTQKPPVVGINEVQKRDLFGAERPS